MSQDIWDTLLAETRAMHRTHAALSAFCPFPDEAGSPFRHEVFDVVAGFGLQDIQVGVAPRREVVVTESRDKVSHPVLNIANESESVPNWNTVSVKRQAVSINANSAEPSTSNIMSIVSLGVTGSLELIAKYPL